MTRQGTLGGNFDIFAASGESTAWVLLWKTRSRPIGVTVCPVAQFKFFKTAFDPRKWTMVVFWKESLGRQPQLITPENEGGGNTNYPSPPTYTFFDVLEVPFGPQGLQPLAPPELHQPQDHRVRLVFRQDGLQLHHQQVLERDLKQEMPRASDLHPHPRPSPHEPQLIPIPMSDGEDDDDQPPQGEWQRQRSRSRERESQRSSSHAVNNNSLFTTSTGNTAESDSSE